MPSPAKPKIDARFAPMRSWMRALTLRSKKTPSAITCRTSRMVNTVLAAAMAISTPTLFARQALHQGERARHVEVLVILGVVQLEDRRRAARGETLDLLQREPSVGRALTVTDVEARLERALDVGGPAQRTREVATHLDVPASLRLLPVHGVEGGDRGHPGERQVHQLGDVLEDGRRQPAELALREPERGHEGGPPFGVAREQTLVLRERGRGEARRDGRGVGGHTRRRCG